MHSYCGGRMNRVVKPIWRRHRMKESPRNISFSIYKLFKFMRVSCFWDRWFLIQDTIMNCHDKNQKNWLTVQLSDILQSIKSHDWRASNKRFGSQTTCHKSFYFHATYHGFPSCFPYSSFPSSSCRQVMWRIIKTMYKCKADINNPQNFIWKDICILHWKCTNNWTPGEQPEMIGSAKNTEAFTRMFSLWLHLKDMTWSWLSTL